MDDTSSPGTPPPFSQPPGSAATPPPPHFNAATPPPPPPPLAPPPILMPPPPPPRRSAAAMLIKMLAIGLCVLFVVFFIAGLTGRSLMGQSRMVQHRTQYLEEILIENNNSQNKILVLDVDGIITSMAVDRSGRSMVDVIDDQFKAAAKDNAIRAVVLKINSPGGEVLASDEIYNRIKEFQQTTKKPVVASMQALAASGGYYIAAPCRWIVANEMTITGSIGVIMQGYNWRGLMDKIGVRPEVFKSGKFKDMLSSDKRPEEITPEERKMVQDLVMETYAKFTNIVATGRSTAANLNNGNGKQLDDSWAEFADGRILSGNQAFKLGFVDELGNFQTAIDRAEVLAKISNANLIRYQEPFDLGSIFKLFGKTDANKVTLDLGLQTPVLRPGYTYFLMPTAVP